MVFKNTFCILLLVLLVSCIVCEEVTVESEPHPLESQKEAPVSHVQKEEKPMYRYDPWTMASDLFRVSESFMDQMWEDIFPSKEFQPKRSNNLPVKRNLFWNLHPQTIPTDVKRLEDKYLVEASVPGYTKDEIHLSLKPSQVQGRSILTISGEKKNKEEEKKDHHFMIRERADSFSRSFSFDATIDPEKVHASFENGDLKVEIPYTENKLESKRIDIH